MPVTGGERHQRSQKYRAPQIIDAKIPLTANVLVKPMREAASDNAAIYTIARMRPLTASLSMKRRILGPEAVVTADFSSTILFAPLDRPRYGVIYAGAQKNIGPAGLTLVIVRE